MQKYFAIFRATLINSLAYPGELLGRSLIILPFMWIFHQLWQVTFAAAGTDRINGLTVATTLWYLMLAETIELSRPRLGNTISDAVKDGSIAYILSKPYDFLLYHYSSSMGETVFRAALNALLGGALVWLLVGPPPQAFDIDQAGGRARFHQDDQAQTPSGQGLNLVRLHRGAEEAARLDGNGKAFGLDASRASMPVPTPVA